MKSITKAFRINPTIQVIKHMRGGYYTGRGLHNKHLSPKADHLRVINQYRFGLYK